MEEIISYFRAFVEGQPDIEPYWKWSSDHDEQLEKSLTRGEFLRLKHEGISEIYAILKRHGYNYPPPSHEDDLHFHKQHRHPLTGVPQEWLDTKSSIKEIEQVVGDSDFFKIDLEIIKAKMQEGDELWHFSNSTEAWANMMGCAGFVLVRSGVQIDGMITLRS